ncbi:MAG: VOC family protein [Micrococcales bacterium]|nr:VOC family protein [Micrococcales bacterium]MCL2667861.1 VOC family protein [Micrococcales bacterium]
MTMLLNPCLSFRDNAREAMEYYRTIFGGDLEIQTFAELHLDQDPADAGKVINAMLTTERGLVLMGADTPAAVPFTPGGSVSLSLSGDEPEELRRDWDGLVDGGTITMPLSKAPWGDTLGGCTDRFGITWFVNITERAYK